MGKSESLKISRNASSKNSKIYAYDSNNYSSKMYTNEYSNSAQTSQFTFGPGPDSKMSETGFSNTNSANKSVNRENAVKILTEKSKRKKSKHKNKKSGTFQKHNRNDSKSSRKSRKSSRRKSSRRHNPSINGYVKSNSKTKVGNKSRNLIHHTSSMNNYELTSKSNSNMKNLYKTRYPQNHQVYFRNGNLPDASPFLTKMTPKSKNSFNEGIRKKQSNKSSEKLLQEMAMQKVCFIQLS